MKLSRTNWEAWNNWMASKIPWSDTTCFFFYGDS